MNKIDVQIENKTYHLLVAETEEEKENGLMGVENLKDDEGMLFDYSDNPEDSLSFWMKDTLIPLDIIFVNQDGVVISVKEGTPKSEDLITESDGPISCVIELNANSGVEPGDRTDLFEDIEDDDDYSNINISHLVIFGSDGQPQGFLKGGERIFSRKSTKVILRKAKKAFVTKNDVDYKSLGRYVFDEMKAQDNRPDDYVEN